MEERKKKGRRKEKERKKRGRRKDGDRKGKGGKGERGTIWHGPFGFGPLTLAICD